MNKTELIAHATAYLKFWEGQNWNPMPGGLSILRDLNDALKDDGWQPIETVDRNGPPVDLWLVPPKYTGSRDLPIHLGARPHRVTDARASGTSAWVDVHGQWITGRRYYLPSGNVALDPDDVTERGWRPTHWRPLPAPPGEQR